MHLGQTIYLSASVHLNERSTHHKLYIINKQSVVFYGIYGSSGHIRGIEEVSCSRFTLPSSWYATIADTSLAISLQTEQSGSQLTSFVFEVFRVFPHEWDPQICNLKTTNPECIQLGSDDNYVDAV